MLLDTVDPLVGIDMPITSIVALAMPPLHLLAYSTLLGTELYQSFVMTKLAYQALPRSAFTSLQKQVFPVYFKGQAFLLGLVALTIPPCGPTSLIDRKGNSITFAVAGGTALLNLLLYGPRAQKLMIKRVHQGMRATEGCVLRRLTAHSNPRLKIHHGCGRDQCRDEGS